MNHALVTPTRKTERNWPSGAEGQGLQLFAGWHVSWDSLVLDFNIPSTALGHLKLNHAFQILLHQFKTQVKVLLRAHIIQMWLFYHVYWRDKPNHVQTKWAWYADGNGRECQFKSAQVTSTFTKCTPSKLPRYNHTGWLGVKHQVSYLLTVTQWFTVSLGTHGVKTFIQSSLWYFIATSQIQLCAETRMRPGVEIIPYKLHTFMQVILHMYQQKRRDIKRVWNTAHLVLGLCMDSK